jgi:hypothetical protein
MDPTCSRRLWRRTWTKETAMSTLVFLALRATHVLCAAVWIGSTAYISLLLTPAVEDAGPAGGQIMMRLDRRGLHTYMAVVAVTTILSGAYLLWRFTGGFDPGVVATHAGIAFGSGGLFGVLAGIIGATVVGRSGAQVVAIMTEAVGVPDGPARGALMQRAGALRQRIKGATRVVMMLQVTALVLMSLGHYV